MRNKIVKVLIFSLIFPMALHAQINFSQENMSVIQSKALSEKKLIFIFAYTPSNSTSRFMTNNVLNDEVLGLFYNQAFICTYINLELEEGKVLKQLYNIQQYPSLLFIKDNGELFYKHNGSIGVADLMDLGQQVLNAFKVNKPIYQQNYNQKFEVLNTDGRFTLGAQGQRLMYGYPYPNSTSHFVVRVNKKFASNAPRFQLGNPFQLHEIPNYGLGFWRKFKSIFNYFLRSKNIYNQNVYKNVHYLKDTLLIEFNNHLSLSSNISYDFENVSITQKLIPLNSQMLELAPDDTASYYKIHYTFENKGNTQVNFGLLSLFDTMIDDNDAAKMDAFKDAELKNGEKISLKNKQLRGKQVIYNNADIPERVLVYRTTAKRTNDLTGDFHFINPPDELHIGSWPLYYSVLWNTPMKYDGQKYFDSAILAKWDDEILEIGQKKEISIIYGLFNKGILEVIPAGTKYTGMNKNGVAYEFDFPKFEVSADTIRKGDTITISWLTKNPQQAEIFINPLSRKKLENNGSIKKVPAKTTTYNFLMRKDGKYLANISKTVVVLPKLEYEELNGRLTFGNDNQALSYGFPLPFSNNFFQIQIGEKDFSNAAFDDGAQKIKANRVINGGDEALNYLFYKTENAIIEQNIKQLKRNPYELLCPDTNFILLSFKIKNISPDTLNGEFSYFINLIDKNESIELSANDSIQIELRNEIGNDDIPSRINIKDTISGELLRLYYNKNKIPTTIIFNEWPQYWSSNKNTIKNAYCKDFILKTNWQYTQICPNDSCQFEILLHSPDNKLDWTYDNREFVDSTNIFFNSNDSLLFTESRTKIIEFLKKNNKKYNIIEIEGHTDNTGSISKNYQLSKSRIEAVKIFITEKLGISSNKILLKAHGEYDANLETNKETADISHRKVVILLYKTKPEEQSTIKK